MGMFTLSTKRLREPDGLVDLEDNTIREKKRHRPLTLRTSPDTFQKPSHLEINQLAPNFRPSALTPVESSDDDDDGDYQKHWPNNETHATSLQELPPSGSPSDAAMDVDTGREPPSLVNGDDLSPWPLNAQNNNGSVQPSPIPRSLIDQSLNIGGHPVAPNQVLSPAKHNSTVPMNHDPILSADGSDWRSPNAAKSQEATWWCHPRLPSPISEDEDIPAEDGKTSASDAEMSYGLSHPASPHSHGLHHDQLPIQASYVNHNINPGVTGPSIPVTNTTPSKKKVTFFMGYRADCDKCQRKVPGHYSHIIHG